MKWLAQQVQHIKQPIEFVLKHVKSIPKLIAAIFLDCLIFCPRRKLNLIGLFLGFQIVTVLAQPSAMLHFDAVSSENGLSENTIRKIYQDSRGYIWVATQDGLNRYDGFTFTVYNHQPENPNSISDNFINEITEDRHGNIWVGTRNGLNVYRFLSNDFQSYMPVSNEKEGLHGSYVLCIAEDSLGGLWIGTDGGGLNHMTFDTISSSALAPKVVAHFEQYVSKPGDSTSILSNSIFNLAFDKFHSMWVGTDKGLCRIKSNAWSTKNTSKEFEHIKIPSSGLASSQFPLYSLVADDKGNIWFGNGNGQVRKVDVFANHEYSLSDPLIAYSESRARPQTAMNDILVNADGSAWFASSMGLFQYVPGTENLSNYTLHKKEYTHSVSLADNYITSLCKDESGLLWIGTVGGITIYDPWKNRFHAQKLPLFGKDTTDYSINAIYVDPQKRHWFATDFYGVRVVDANHKSFVEIAALNGFSVNAFVRDAAGDMWFATSGHGVARIISGDLFSGNEEKIRPNAKAQFFLHDKNDTGSLSSNMVLCIANDIYGGLWIGTGKGLCFLNKERTHLTKITFNSNDASLFTDKIIRDIHCDKKGMLWVCTDGGLFSYSIPTGKITHFVHDSANPNALSHTRINCIHEDKSGQLWIGTNGGGLDLFDKTTGQVKAVYSNSQGLPNNVIYSIEEDTHGNLWVSTNKGICKFNPKTSECSNYDTRDGLLSNEFILNSSYCADDGTFYFGSNNGYNSFQPDSIRKNEYIPKVVLTDVKIFDQSVFSGTSSEMRIELLGTKMIQLPFKKNSIAFEFAALSFLAPEKNKYAYWLEGFDHEWIQAGTRRFVSYTNLDPGTYIFHVKASNNDGVWNETGIDYTIVISPPWYRTFWFRILLAIFISMIVFFIYQARLRNLELKKEKEVAIQTTRMKEQFLANMSHEIRTPLNAIMGMTRLLREKEPKPDQLKYLDAITQSSDNLLVIINDILDISKIEAGKIELEKIPFSIKIAFSGIYNTLRFKAEEKGLTFSTTIPDDMHDYFIGDQVRLSQMLINLVGNAIKFTEHGSVTLKCTCQPMHPEIGTIATVQFEVIDTGIGIAPENLHKIFESFTQESSETTRKFGGTGLGLAISKKLAELQHGTIEVKSEAGKGTSFLVSIPYPASDTPVIPAINHIPSEELRKSLSGISILLVEDNDFNRIVAVDTLQEELSDIRIDIAVNGLEAVEKVRSASYDVVLMDVQMPEMNGYDATKTIRLLDSPACDTKIIAMTASALKDEVERCYQAGMNDFIAKPFDTEDLLKKIKRMISAEDGK